MPKKLPESIEGAREACIRSRNSLNLRSHWVAAQVRPNHSHRVGVRRAWWRPWGSEALPASSSPQLLELAERAGVVSEAAGVEHLDACVVLFVEGRYNIRAAELFSILR